MDLRLRALLAFLALPGVVAFAVPLLIAATDSSRGAVFPPGALVVAAGLGLLLRCVRDFLVVGRGTLAPWDPPRRLVVVGLYRHVRNPMYVAVLVLVAGWALLLASWWIAAWAAVVAVGFHVRVVRAEEPWLAAQFGEAWQRYRAHVRRWWPRLAPWTDERATPYAIVPAGPQDVAALPAIELAAARLLEGRAPASILAEATSLDDLRRAQVEGRLWVARDGDVPVGFAIGASFSARHAHLVEVDVLPSHGRRGIGAALVRAVCVWAADRGHDEITLTTFRDVPWNMPFYARLGFVEIPPAELDDDLVATLRDEAARGLVPERRVAMRLRLRRPDTARAR